MTSKKPPVKFDPFTRAIAIAGNENRLAKLTNYSQHAIWWARNHGTMTAEMALRIEMATGVPASALRPDLFKPRKASKPRKTSKKGV